MQETINSLLVSIHEFLYPARNAIFIVGILSSILVAYYYKARISSHLISGKRLTRTAILQAGLAVFIVSYAATLEIQEPIFLDNLVLFLPLCTLPLPILLMLFLWVGYYFGSKSKNVG